MVTRNMTVSALSLLIIALATRITGLRWYTWLFIAAWLALTVVGYRQDKARPARGQVNER